MNSSSTPQVEENTIPAMSSDTSNNIVLTAEMEASSSQIPTNTGMYKAFDRNDSTYFQYTLLTTQPTIILTIDCTNNSEFSNGKYVSKIRRKDIKVGYNQSGKTIPRSMKVTFFLGDLVQSVIEKYNVVGLEEDISFEPILYNKIVIVYSDFNFTGAGWDINGLCISSLEILGNTTITQHYQNTDFALGAFNEKNWYPCCGCFNNDRLVLAGTKKQPYTLWASKTGIYNDFGVSEPMEETDSIDINLPSVRRDCPDIYNIVNFSKLLVLSSSAESTVDLKEVSQTPQSQRGSSKVAPCVVGNTVLFIGAQNKTLREFTYDMLNDTYSSNEISFNVKSLLNNRTIKQLVYLQEPSSLVYILLSDGSMLILSYTKEENVMAFSTFEMDNGFIEDICGLDTQEGSILYMVVNRYNNTRYIEKLEPRVVDKTMQGVFLDCYSNYSDVSSITGLERFEGQKITCVCDGEIQNMLVVDGTISFDKCYDNVVVGLSYESKLEILSAVY